MNSHVFSDDFKLQYLAEDQGLPPLLLGSRFIMLEPSLKNFALGSEGLL